MKWTAAPWKTALIGGVPPAGSMGGAQADYAGLYNTKDFVSAGWTKWLNQVENLGIAAQGYGVYQEVIPVNGGTVNSNDQTEHLILNPPSTIATLTVVLPPNPNDGNTFKISTTQDITSLTVTANKPIFGTVTSLSANTSVQYLFVLGQGWFLETQGGGGGGGGAGITQLIGDVTATGPGIATATLAASGVAAGAYKMANVTFDAKGRATTAATGNPMTTAGDIIVGGAAGAATRLPVGASPDGYVLTLASATPAWQVTSTGNAASLGLVVGYVQLPIFL